MRKVAVSLFVLCSLFASARHAVAQTPGEKIVAKAREILHDCKDTTYDHKTDINESTGTYHCDCSALVGYILKQVSPEHYKSLIVSPHHRALAVSFYETFAGDPTTRPSTGRWQPIVRAIDAQPGDVLAWRKVEMKPGDTTGHVVVINSQPVVDGPHLVRVEVIDSTTNAHAEDTRHKGENGVGKGTIWIDVDDAGRPTGYHPRSRSAKGMDVPISIGRAIAGPTTQP